MRYSSSRAALSIDRRIASLAFIHAGSIEGDEHVVIQSITCRLAGSRCYYGWEPAYFLALPSAMNASASVAQQAFAHIYWYLSRPQPLCWSRLNSFTISITPRKISLPWIPLVSRRAL